MFDNPVMRFLRYMALNGMTLTALVLGGLGISTIAGNLFIGISILFFFLTLLMACFLSENVRNEVFPKMAADPNFKMPKRAVPKKADFVMDLVLVLGSFAFGYWICGIVWLFHMFINVTVSDYLFDPENYNVVVR